MKQARQACKPARHPLALAVASALALVSLPVAAQTSQWQLGSHPIATAGEHINTTQINFGGHEWVVIGNTSKDIYKGSHDGGTYGHANADANSVTLLSISDDFGNSEFRASGSGCGSYTGTCMTRPHEYQGSTLQGAMNDIANGLSDKEQNEINARTLTTADGINGNTATGLLWALSVDEWNAIGNDDTRKYPSSWWLRSPYFIDDYALAG
ncbi:hypothetical protein FACS189488_09030 [Betaproteobacteria bacterium]|nr:hypothetical protein FACS189488_09030 [Betaproteobacteria bacterium]